MKYTCMLRIERPLQTVWTFFIDPANLSQWSRGFSGYELLEGRPGSVGARVKHRYEERDRPLEFIDEITEVEPLRRLCSRKKHSTMEINVVNNFRSVGDSVTELDSQVEVKFLTPMFKLLGPFMKSEFRNRQNADFKALKNALEAK